MYHPLCQSMLLSPSNATEHSQAIALDGASKVLIVADQIAIGGTPNVVIKIQTSEDMVNWVTPVVGSPNQNELQLTATAPSHGESGTPAGTAITVVHCSCPGASPPIEYEPPSTGTARFHSTGSTGAPLRLTTSPSIRLSSGTEIVRYDSRGSIALMRSAANCFFLGSFART